jgi:hypothetical protein
MNIKPLNDNNTKITNKLFIFDIIFCDENVNTDPMLEVNNKGPEKIKKEKVKKEKEKKFNQIVHKGEG